MGLCTFLLTRVDITGDKYASQMAKVCILFPFFLFLHLNTQKHFSFHWDTCSCHSIPLCVKGTICILRFFYFIVYSFYGFKLCCKCVLNWILFTNIVRVKRKNCWMFFFYWKLCKIYFTSCGVLISLVFKYLL